MSQIALAQPVNMKQFKSLLAIVSPEHSICVRGRHAVGKSEGVYQAATEMRSDFYKNPENCARVVEMFGGVIKTPNGKVTEWNYEMGIPVLERRLSQMTEGDIIGLPFMSGADKFDANGHRLSSASTSFKPCDWLINSTIFPVVLFLDERNRALEGVKQAVFQLTDSKAFYGSHLHPETRIVVAENDGDNYQVQQCDPAEISRCATVILEPSVKDWLDYAGPRCNEATVEFIRQNERLLEHRESTFEPNKKYPDRRTWFKLDQELERLGFFEDPTSPMLHTLATAFLGIEAGNKFTQFLKERDREVSAADILKDWSKSKKRLAGKQTITAEQYVESSNKIGVYTEKHDLTYEQAEQLARFMKDCPSEVVLSTWANIQKRPENLARVHKFIMALLLNSVQGTDNSQIKIPTAKEVREEAERKKGKTATPAATQNASGEDVGEPKKRGARS